MNKKTMKDTPTDNQINRRLAKFARHINVGITKNGNVYTETKDARELHTIVEHFNYTESVNACLSLLEKLKKQFQLQYWRDGDNYIWMVHEWGYDEFSRDKSLSRALSLALFEAIGEKE